MTGNPPSRAQRAAEQREREEPSPAPADPEVALLYRRLALAVCARDAATDRGDAPEARRLADLCAALREEIGRVDPPQPGHGHLTAEGRENIARGQRLRRAREAAAERRQRYRRGPVRAAKRKVEGRRQP